VYLLIHCLVFHLLSSIVHWILIIFMHSYFRSVISHHNSLQQDKKIYILWNSSLAGMLFTLFNRPKEPYAAKIHYSIAHYCYMFALCQKGILFQSIELVLITFCDVKFLSLYQVKEIISLFVKGRLINNTRLRLAI